MHGIPLGSKVGIALLVWTSAFAWGCVGGDREGGITEDGDAGTQPPPAPAPISGTAGEWNWLDVPDSECANGEPTGLGFNIGTSKDLVIFFEGGGACWDEYYCLTLKTASYVDGFTRETWDKTKPAGLATGGLFDRTAANNPYKDSSFVYIPYCTGDIHGGDAVQQFSNGRTMHYSGRKNVEAYLAKIVPSFKDASRVTMAGRSAGGFGAAINYWRAKRAFGDVRVDLLDDSGPPFDQALIPLFGTWTDTWNLAGALPPDCAACQTNIREVLPYYARTYPNARIGFLSYTRDTVISQFFFQSLDQFQGNLKTFTEGTVAPLPNARYFVAPSEDHTMTGKLSVTSEGTSLGDWIHDFATDAPTWKNVSPL